MNKIRAFLPVLVLLGAIVSMFAFPAIGQEPTDPTGLAGRGDDMVVIAGPVTSATDTDEDGKNDTFVINTGGTLKTVNRLAETDEMGVIAVGDHVEIEVEVKANGDLEIKDVLKIGPPPPAG